MPFKFSFAFLSLVVLALTIIFSSLVCFALLVDGMVCITLLGFGSVLLSTLVLFDSQD